MLLSTLYPNDQHLVSQSNLQRLKTNLGLGQKDCQHIVIDEFLCMVTGCALGTDVCNCPGGNHPGGQMAYRGFNWWRIGGGRLSGGNCPRRGIDLDLKQL